MSTPDFGKASRNGHEDGDAVEVDSATAVMLMDEESDVGSPDDASEQDVEDLRREIHELRQELQKERLRRKELKKEFEDEIESLRSTVEELQREEETNEGADLVEMEWRARNESYEEMTSNVERAVKVWEELPNYGGGSSKGDKLTLTYDQLKTAISIIDSRPKREVRSETVKRVRNNLKNMSDGLVSVKEKEGTDRRKRHQTSVHVQDWAEQRKDAVVRSLLPEKVAETILGGDCQ